MTCSTRARATSRSPRARSAASLCAMRRPCMPAARRAAARDAVRYSSRARSLIAAAARSRRPSIARPRGLRSRAPARGGSSAPSAAARRARLHPHPPSSVLRTRPPPSSAPQVCRLRGGRPRPPPARQRLACGRSDVDERALVALALHLLARRARDARGWLDERRCGAAARVAARAARRADRIDRATRDAWQAC